MDGNGRWAKERGMDRVFGHREGVESVRACAEAAIESGVRYLSLFAFSEENWNRPQDEVKALMDLMFKTISEEFGTLIDNGVRLLVLGNRDRLSQVLNEAIDLMEEQTKGNDTLTLILFISYSGKWDILQAAKKMAMLYASAPERMEDLTMDVFSSMLVTSDIPDPDLIVRTSGEKRISNYLLWQAAYSEFVYTDVLWPDFRKKEFKDALNEYSLRDRRYGKVK